MKKGVNVLFALVLVLSIVMVTSPQKVEAISVVDPSLAEGVWSTGTEVMVDLTAAPAPAWLQLMAKGVILPAAATICHPFRGGQFGWTADIRQLVDGKWIKVATTQGWVPTREGKFTACAIAPAAGTYAFFAYYKVPDKVVDACNYSTASWDAGVFYNGEVWYFYAEVDNLPVGVMVTYDVVVPDFNLSVDSHGSATTYLDDPYVYADFTANPLSWEQSWTQVTLRISAEGCSKNVVVPFPES
jgi:hypothetical protein